MPLAPTEAIRDLIRDDFKQGSGPCAVNGGVPVFVRYEDSVIEPPKPTDIEVESQIHRPAYRGPIKFLKRLASPIKQVTLRNVDRFLSEMKALNPNPRVLIVGGGSVGQGMGKLYDDPNVQIFAFDIYQSPNIQFVADAHDIPMQDDVFDGVVIQAVLEHVLDPRQVASEIHRVLKPGGLIYAETPFLQQVHEGPYDFTRFTESGHRYLFRAFERIDSGASAGPGVQFMWSVDYLFRGLFRSRTAGKVAKLCVFWAQYLDRLIPEPYRVDGASGVFFLGRKSDTVLKPKEAVTHYQGAQ
ncbi:class I SAM-dependent methyltransferase [Ruegeria sp. EL01]|uniref:class I SAM-dependent methyltransferase n=1 Tax=Ruegeria sp. EL01 TaxID=2107578 RepID=UPI000EA808D3|nr:class I SAM-dependent methyltransferase [Ruegeria sp. EL01]